MPNPATQVIKLSGFPPKVPNVPPNYPVGKSQPGDIEKLLRANSSYYYHQFSPFTNYHDSILSPILSNKQPFVYTYIDEAQNSTFANLPVSVQGLAQIAQITPGTLNDVVRVSKFLISSWGVQFLITQAAVQRLAPFDETRIYNPLSPILATVAPMTLGIGNMPIRHIEGGLLGLAGSVTSTVGINLQSGFQTPSSTVGDSALPKDNKGQGKGLIRGGTAGKGKAQLQMKWPVSDTQVSAGGGLGAGLSSMVSAMGAAAGQMFGITKVRQPSGTQVRADEATQLMMALSYKMPKQAWHPSSKITTTGGAPVSTTPSVLSGLNTAINAVTSFAANPIGSLLGGASSLLNGLGASPGGNQALSRVIWLSNPDGTFKPIPMDSGLKGETINGKPTGYDVKDGDKYGKAVGPAPSDDTFTNSDVLVQYSYYLNEKNNYPTKVADKDRTDKLNAGLQKIVNKINATGLYSVIQSPSSFLLPSGGGSNTYIKYDNWTAKSKQTLDNTFVNGEYNTVSNKPKALDISVAKESKDTIRMATSFASDGMNSLGVLGKDKKITGDNSSIASIYSDWKVLGWRPYEDDLIAFYFYDVVNEKYIPFRATVKGISEGATAFWDELRFIGRADQLYSYNGFSRTLNFSFNVVINSVTELMPSWKKINYMVSAVKPSNYTTGQQQNQKFNRFIVPPMFMLTIGDLYKFQPIVITSITVNIPEDASWETLNEDNSRFGWSYLNGLITSPQVKKNYGQLPRECEIAVVCNLLEKERAIVGGSNFGHQPRTDEGNKEFYTDTSVEFLPDITDLHKGFVEWNMPAITPNPSTQTPGPNIQTLPRATQGINRGGQTYPINDPTKTPSKSGNDANGVPQLESPVLPPVQQVPAPAIIVPYTPIT